MEELTGALQKQLTQTATAPTTILATTSTTSFNALTHSEANAVYQPPLGSTTTSIELPPTPREITQTDHLNAQLLASAMRMDFSFLNRILNSSKDADDDDNNNKW